MAIEMTASIYGLVSTLVFASLPLVSDAAPEFATVIHYHHLLLVGKIHPLAFRPRSHSRGQTYASSHSVEGTIVDEWTHGLDTPVESISACSLSQELVSDGTETSVNIVCFTGEKKPASFHIQNLFLFFQFSLATGPDRTKCFGFHKAFLEIIAGRTEGARPAFVPSRSQPNASQVRIRIGSTRKTLDATFDVCPRIHFGHPNPLLDAEAVFQFVGFVSHHIFSI